MKIFPANLVNQGSPAWWELRRGIPTASGFEKILTPKTMKPSAQADDLMAELAADVANQSPNWFSERFNKPPNRAIEEGVRREAESRAWLAMERECDVQQVGFCLHDNGLWGCSPDGILIADSGSMAGTLELKNPQLATQARYLMIGELPPEYRCQVAGHLVVTGLPSCTFLSYAPPMEPLLIVVRPDEFSARLEAALVEFTRRYLDVLDKLKLRGRFEEQRQNALQHYPEA